MLTIRAVVRHQIKMIAACAELVFKNHDVLVAEADNDVDLAAGFLESLGRRESDRTSDAAADNAHALEAFSLRGPAERSDKVMDVVAFVKCAKHLGGQADLLEDDGHGSLFTVIARDGQRNALAGFIDAEDDKLPCFGLSCNKGRLDLQQRDRGVQLLLANDLEHTESSFQKCFAIFPS